MAACLISIQPRDGLRRSEARLEEAQRVAHVGYWERDPDTHRITWSDETYRIFGLTPREATITVAEMLGRIHPEDRPIWNQAATEALRGASRYDLEYRVLRPDGELRIVHSQGDLRRDASGGSRSMFGTIQDITDRRRAEEALQQPRPISRVLNRVMLLEEMATSIAHEVNQPISAVITNADAGMRWLAAREPDLDEVRQALGRIVRDGTRRWRDYRPHPLARKENTAAPRSLGHQRGNP